MLPYKGGTNHNGNRRLARTPANTERGSAMVLMLWGDLAGIVSMVSNILLLYITYKSIREKRKQRKRNKKSKK